MSKIDFVELKDEEITIENLDGVLNNLFYTVRACRGYNDEAQDQLYSCLDGSPCGVLGVQLLSSDLHGTGYNLVTYPDGTRGYEKKEPVDPQIIYPQINKLIDVVNSLTDPNYVRQLADAEEETK
jgi:hypothetical protein